jgi:hypothetical protein
VPSNSAPAARAQHDPRREQHEAAGDQPAGRAARGGEDAVQTGQRDGEQADRLDDADEPGRGDRHREAPGGDRGRQRDGRGHANVLRRERVADIEDADRQLSSP